MGGATLYSLFAKEQLELGYKGISTFIVACDTPVLCLGHTEDKIGQRSTDTRELILEEVRIPSRSRLGEGQDGFKIAMMTLEASRPVVGCQAVGIARAAFEPAVACVKQQVLSDKPVIAS